MQGHNLREILDREGLLPLSRVLAIGRGRTGSGLRASPTASGRHRDIKPQNILIEDDTDRVVVMDFGIAKLLGEQQTQYTGNGIFIGTLTYSAPEQIRSDLTVDGRADIFSLGLMMYEMITGRGFFTGLTQQEIITRQLHGMKDYALHFPSRVPAAFRQLVAKAVAKDRNRRFATAGELLDALAKASENSSPRPRWSVPLLAGATLIGLGLLAAWIWLPIIPTLETMRQALAPWLGSAELTQPAMPGGAPGHATPPQHAIPDSSAAAKTPTPVSRPVPPPEPKSIQILPELLPSPPPVPIISAPARLASPPDRLEIQRDLEKALQSPPAPVPRPPEPDSPFDPDQELEQALQRKHLP